MSTKWNEVTLKKYIEDNSECQYISHTKDSKNIYLNLICSCGNSFKATKGSFDKGQKQCRECGLNKHHEKLTLWNETNLNDYVKQQSDGKCDFQGYHREGHNIYLQLKCSCGNEFTTLKSAFDKMKVKQCPKCAFKMAGEHSWDWNEQNLKEHVEKNSSCLYISHKRVNKLIELTLKCPCGEIFNATKKDFDKWKKYCPKCGKKNRIKKTTKWDNEALSQLVSQISDCKYLGFFRNEKRQIILKLKCRCGRDFQTNKRHFENGKTVCNICNGMPENIGEISLAEKCPESLKLWDYEKNDDTPYDISYASNQKRWFKCHNNIHESEYKLIGGFSSGNRCSICSRQLKESRLATTLKQVLKHNYPQTIWEYDAGFRGLNGGVSKYDIYVPELNLLIEVQSHYHEEEEQKKSDKLKKEFAISNGYNYNALDCRVLTPLEGVQVFFPNIKSIPSYVFDLKDTLRNWDVTLAQKIINEDNDLTYDEIGESLGVNGSTIKSAIRDGILDGSKHKIHNKGCRKSIVQLTLDGEYIKTFLKITDAEEETGINNIHACCKGQYKFAGNYIWMYEKDYLEILKGNEKIETQVPRSRKIVQLDLNGNFINEFNTIKEASEKHMVTHSAIINCLKGKAKTSKGYKWMYKDDYEKIYNITNQAS
jgi:hypothetical protein